MIIQYTKRGKKNFSKLPQPMKEKVKSVLADYKEGKLVDVKKLKTAKIFIALQWGNGACSS